MFLRKPTNWKIAIALLVMFGGLRAFIEKQKRDKTTEARTTVRKLHDWELAQFYSAKKAEQFKTADFRFPSLGKSLKEVPKGTCVPYSDLEPQWKPLLEMIKNSEGCFRYQYRVYGCPGAPECDQGLVYRPKDEEYFTFFAVEAVMVYIPFFLAEMASTRNMISPMKIG